jgi:hypothetical protein
MTRQTRTPTFFATLAVACFALVMMTKALVVTLGG